LTTFFLLAAAGVAVVLLLLLPALIKRRKESSGSSASSASPTTAVNAEIIKDQLAELDRDFANGTLSVEDLAQAKTELQKRLLEDSAADHTPPVRKFMARRSAWIIGIVLPLGAVLLYFALGNLPALTPDTPQPGQPKVSAQQVEDMVAQLAAKLEKNPDDAQGWVMLARSYKILGRYADANHAYERAGGIVDGDPQLLTDYAESLAFTTGRSLKGKPTQLIERALALEPDHPQTLVLAGTAAFERGDYAVAVTYWERLQKQLAPDSDDAKMLASGIKKARGKIQESGTRNQK